MKLLSTGLLVLLIGSYSVCHCMRRRKPTPVLRNHVTRIDIVDPKMQVQCAKFTEHLIAQLCAGNITSKDQLHYILLTLYLGYAVKCQEFFLQHREDTGKTDLLWLNYYQTLYYLSNQVLARFNTITLPDESNRTSFFEVLQEFQKNMLRELEQTKALHFKSISRESSRK